MHFFSLVKKMGQILSGFKLHAHHIKITDLNQWFRVHYALSMIHYAPVKKKDKPNQIAWIKIWKHTFQGSTSSRVINGTTIQLH